MLQISESATSPALADNSKYASFFRTIGSDNLQGKRLVELCKEFGWKRIGVIYQNDNYGQNFNRVIGEEADNNGIEVHSRQYKVGDNTSINDSADFIQASNTDEDPLYVTILIMQGRDIKTFIQRFESKLYPYYFVCHIFLFMLCELLYIIIYVT